MSFAEVVKKEPEQLRKEEKEVCLRIARYILSEYVRSNGKTPAEAEILERFKISKTTHPLLFEGRGVFVTLEVGRHLPAQQKRLRGCIGYITGSLPLFKGIIENAINACSEDPRFPQVVSSELKSIAIEISVMTPLVEIQAENVIVGKHGLEIRKRGRSGLLLPQVATEYNWTREEFLSHTCLKAGLDSNAWKEKGTKILSFEAQVFNEDEFPHLYTEADSL